LKNLTTKQNKLPAALIRLSLQLFVEWLKQNSVPVFKLVFAEKYLFNAAQLALTKMQRNEAKVFQETDFLRGTEGHLLTSSGCFLI